MTKNKNWAVRARCELEKCKNRQINAVQLMQNVISLLINKIIDFLPTLFDKIFKSNWAKLRTVPGVGLDAYVYATCEDLHHPKHKSIVLAH